MCGVHFAIDVSSERSAGFCWQIGVFLGFVLEISLLEVRLLAVNGVHLITVFPGVLE